MKPHKHAELIKAWADGAEIEFRTRFHNGEFSNWSFAESPSWDVSVYEYRIKPEPKPDFIAWESNGCLSEKPFSYDAKPVPLYTAPKELSDKEIYDILWTHFPISDKEKNETFIAVMTHCIRVALKKASEK
jgi:hypothetical protein